MITSRQREALELLANDDPDIPQQQRINALTAQEAGYTLRRYGTYSPAWSEPYPTYQLITPDGEPVEHTDSLEDIWLYAPDYCSSVDVCLTLTIPEGTWWELVSQSSNSHVCSATILLERNRQFAKTLPIAMLRAWWQIQGES